MRKRTKIFIMMITFALCLIALGFTCYHMFERDINEGTSAVLITLFLFVIPSSVALFVMNVKTKCNFFLETKEEV